MILTHWHEITERRHPDVINQRMEVIVDYDPINDDIEVIKCDIYQDNYLVAEISSLLDKAEGEPLNTILNAIDWRELYRGKYLVEEDANN